MSQSQSVAQSKPENLEKTWHQRETGKLLISAINSKKNPEEIETNPENIYLPPMRNDTPEGAFRAGGDLWFESD